MAKILSKEALKNKENAFLLHKYRNANRSSGTLCEFVREIKSELSEETWASVLHRNTSASLKSLIVMASELKCTNREIVSLLNSRKEHAIARVIENPDLTDDFKQIIAKLKRLAAKDQHKVDLVMNMIDGLLK